MTEEQYEILKAKVREYEGLHKKIRRLSDVTELAKRVHRISMSDNVSVLINLEPQVDKRAGYVEEAEVIEELLEEIKICIDRYCTDKIVELRQVAGTLEMPYE